MAQRSVISSNAKQESMPTELHQERDLYLDKLKQVAEIIGSDDPLHVVHDVRNIMNELRLLKKLVDLDQ
jgi:hypothetical protein